MSRGAWLLMRGSPRSGARPADLGAQSSFGQRVVSSSRRGAVFEVRECPFECFTLGPSGTSLQTELRREGKRDERQRRDRDPCGRLLLARTGIAAPPRRSHLHPGRIHPWGERHPDRRKPSGSRRGGRDRLRPRISYRNVLEFFFQIHRPDLGERLVGSSYRSEIFYTTDEQRQVAEDPIADLAPQVSFPARS